MFLFVGYPFFRLLLPIWGFFAGVAFGVNGMQSLFGANLISSTFGFAAGLVAGIVLAILAYTAYSIAVYIFGLTIGYVVGSGLMMAVGLQQGFWSTVVGIVVAVVFLVLFARIQMPKFLVVFLTAVGGAMAVIMGLFVLFGKIPEIAASLQLTGYLVSGSWFWLTILIVLAAVGMTFQYATIQAAREDWNDPYDWNVRKKKKKR